MSLITNGHSWVVNNICSNDWQLFCIHMTLMEHFKDKTLKIESLRQ